MHKLTYTHTFRSSESNTDIERLSTSHRTYNPQTSRRDVKRYRFNNDEKEIYTLDDEAIDGHYIDLSTEAQNNIISALQSLTKEYFPKTLENRNNGNKKQKLTSAPKTARNFDDYYEKSCKTFLQNRNKKIEKQRIQKDEEEIQCVTSRPLLISKQELQHIPLFERVKMTQNKKQKEIEKLKKEREEKEKKELKNLTFQPNINQITDTLLSHLDKVDVIERLYTKESNSRQNLDSGNENKFKPKINEISKVLAEKIIKFTSKKVEERLFLQAQISKHNKEKLCKETMSFTPRLTKNTLKIIEKIRNKDEVKKESIERQNKYPHSQKFSHSSSYKMSLTTDDGNNEVSGKCSFQRKDLNTTTLMNHNLNEDFDKTKMDNQILNNLKQLTFLLRKENNNSVCE